MSLMPRPAHFERCQRHDCACAIRAGILLTGCGDYCPDACWPVMAPTRSPTGPISSRSPTWVPLRKTV